MAPPPSRSAGMDASLSSPSRGVKSTIVAIPGMSPRAPQLSPTRVVRLAGSGTGAAGTDPNFLLDTLYSHHHHHNTAPPMTPKLDSTSTTTNTSTAEDPTQADPIEFLNRHYTSEQLLVQQLPDLRQSVGERMERLDDRISNALQRQSETAQLTRRHVQDSKASVTALVNRIHLVQEKAQQSEVAVLEITRDMKRMDLAKKHLQRTITTLKRLHMLIHAVEQLRLACLQTPFPDYKTAAHLVDATRLLLQHFQAYTHKVEPMIRLAQKVTDLQEHLRLGLVRGFRLKGLGLAATKQIEALAAKRGGKTLPPLDDEHNNKPPVMSPAVMEGGVLLVDALGHDQRRRFIIQFCQDQLAPYKQDYQPVAKGQNPQKRVSSFKVVENPEPEPAPIYGLDSVEKRFVWFRDRVTQINQQFAKVFPSYWNMQYSLCRAFLIMTKEHFLQLLSGPKKDADANNATILLKALQKTIVFEKETMAWLPREFGTKFISPNNNEAEINATQQQQQQPADDGAASTEQTPVESLLGVCSVAFEKFMGPYIALEDQSMDEQLINAVDDRTVDNRGEMPVFTSSTKLFVYIKGSIARCNAMSKGHAFYLLYEAFQGAIRKYAQVLSGKLPQQQVSQTGVSGGLNLPGFGTVGKQQQENNNTSSTYRIPQGEEMTVCYVVSTCEYCADTVEALEDLIRDTIDDAYKPKIDMMAQQEVFHDVTAKAIRVLVLGLGNRVENAWKMMASINWGAFDMVGEESSYVRTMHEEIQPFVTTCRGHLPTPHFRSFCDKFATAFTKTYYNALVHLKKINEQATQQLLLDIYSLKTLFLKLPVLEPKSTSSITKKVASTIAPAMYTKMIHKQFGRIETLLKLVGTPADLLIDVFKVQWPGGSALDLQSVMSLKGMKRTDQAAILEKFGLDPATAMRGAHMGVTSASLVQERLQAVTGNVGNALQDRLGTDVAAKVNSDLTQMRQKVDDFRKSFR
ncbi:sorting-associated protein 53 homolog [Seminavis robusta]|uniref:Sorting-associated protein 53 homolog n=1 Tax=Seminavis robusta TaxID=568900 RepID=A0A9N8HVL3_9STRA|nr:sorting-associated protein 53 homolog [Seminavis robusta]|eukprot:Sro1828_g300180.1 sorting-associated protein 53 homolog (970) ;mRNA; f:5491-8491